jgi:2-phospho-L-lactate guanylyltransferase
VSLDDRLRGHPAPERASAVWAVLPVKAFSRGKSRLGVVLSDPLRAAFARSLFDHVIAAMGAAPRLRGIVVVTDDDEVAAHARAKGLVVVPDPEERTLSAVVNRGLGEVRNLGGSAALVCMADLPRLAAAEIEAVIDALVEHAVVVVPDLVDAGTNVLCIAPPQAFPSCFGRADSFVRHLARAREHGYAPLTLRLPGLSFDVDGPEDLERLG